MVRGVVEFIEEVDTEDELKEMLIAKHPIGRLGEADDIAKGVLFLASDESSFMTGSELVIDGGYTAV
jgi:NAD(P)-dependent dehydrogenase (short-subunit alcohol dehydrogenase family)